MAEVDGGEKEKIIKIFFEDFKLSAMQLRHTLRAILGHFETLHSIIAI